MSKTRIPTQKRSIEKRNKIIEKGFELICEKGFYNTNTAEIAKYANVSTGIIYQYFNDKDEIFLEGVKNYSNKILFPVLDNLEEEIKNTKDLNILVENIIDRFVKNHTMSKKAHEELMSMTHLNDSISKVFNDNEVELTKKIVNILEDNEIHLKNAFEKIHIIIGILDNFCHEVVYHKHKIINYDVMKEETINIIVNILKRED